MPARHGALRRFFRSSRAAAALCPDDLIGSLTYFFRWGPHDAAGLTRRERARDEREQARTVVRDEHELRGVVDVGAREHGSGDGTPARALPELEVAAGALNFPDVLICRGGDQVRPPLPFTPGAEVAGRVLAVGEGVDPALVGRRVIAVPDFGPGGFTEITVARASQVFPIPDTMPDVEAAALHVTYQTGHLALHRRAAIRPGETRRQRTISKE